MTIAKHTFRQLFIEDLGHEEPTVLLTNQRTRPVKQLITRYAQRMLIENALSDAVRFFHVNALSSAVAMKVDFDLALLVIASGLYRRLATAHAWLRRGTGPTDLPRPPRHASDGQGHAHAGPGDLPPPRTPAHRARLDDLRRDAHGPVVERASLVFSSDGAKVREFPQAWKSRLESAQEIHQVLFLGIREFEAKRLLVVLDDAGKRGLRAVVKVRRAGREVA